MNAQPLINTARTLIAGESVATGGTPWLGQPRSITPLHHQPGLGRHSAQIDACRAVGTVDRQRSGAIDRRHSGAEAGLPIGRRCPAVVTQGSELPVADLVHVGPPLRRSPGRSAAGTPNIVDGRSGPSRRHRNIRRRTDRADDSDDASDARGWHGSAGHPDRKAVAGTDHWRHGRDQPVRQTDVRRQS